MKLNLKARLVAALPQFKADNDIRYYLNGVYVEPIEGGGALIVATNGHAMGVWRDMTGEVERPAVLRIGKRLESACLDSDYKRLVIIDDRLAVLEELPNKTAIKMATKTPITTEVYVQEKTGTKGSWEVPGTYPIWRKVVQGKAQQNLTDTLSAVYINTVRKALKIGTGDASAYIAFLQGEKDKGIAVTSRSAPDFFGVIMPVREEAAAYPDWVAALIQPEAEAPAAQPSDAAPPYDAVADGVAIEVIPETVEVEGGAA